MPDVFSIVLNDGYLLSVVLEHYVADDVHGLVVYLFHDDAGHGVRLPQEGLVVAAGEEEGEEGGGPTPNPSPTQGRGWYV